MGTNGNQAIDALGNLVWLWLIRGRCQLAEQCSLIGDLIGYLQYIAPRFRLPVTDRTSSAVAMGFCHGSTTICQGSIGWSAGLNCAAGNPNRSFP
ncbi:MAG: hypothetical protein BJG00_016255 [Limnothrix sp. CACIAM 69d]|nr:MAG: hypothetical protein BJG00_016255 [Limnothrix sp. CACIAM 69d]